MTSDILMQRDTVARQKIVEQIQSNFFVEAGAGSGKTTILVDRMVAMVEHGLDVSKICAITFTKAAASEFYERFQKKLIQRSTATAATAFSLLGQPTDETRCRCVEALNNLDLCFMGTIDAFCNMVLSEHPAKAGIPSNAELVSDEDIVVHYKKVYSQIQKGEHGAELQRLCRQFRGFYKKPDSTFTGAISTIMDTRNCQHIFTPMPKGSLDEILEVEKTKLLSVLQKLQAHQELKYVNAKTDNPAWETLKTKEKLLNSPWQDNIYAVSQALKNIRNIRLIPETDLSVLGPAGEAFFEAHYGRSKTKIACYVFKEDGLTPLMDRINEIQYAASMAFLTAAAEKIAEILRKEGKLTYFDYLLYLRDTLRTDAADEGKLIRHIYERHQYFLIDEFQDTNPMQAEVFFYLTAQNPQEDWRKCDPHPGSLFIVGDPKQSIYRFRNADVSAFLQIKKLFDDGVGEVVKLTRNFRSTYKMRSWFNDTFQVLLPETTHLQSQYELIPLEEAPEADGTFEGVYSYSVVKGKNAAPEDRDSAKVAKIIRRIVDNPAYMIPDGQGTRKVEYQDIMLITPAKGRMGDFIQVFVEQEIPFRIEGKVLFSQCPALVAVARIFAALADPHSVKALVGALTCKRFGFDLNGMHRLREMGYELGMFKTLPEDEPISEAIQQLEQLVRRSHQLSAAALFTLILEELQIFRYTGAKNLEYVYFALELLRSAESSGQFSSLSQAAAYLELLISDTSETERTISLTQNENCVHIANLHKVKGLEAPIVILADPQMSDPKPNISVVQQEPKPLCWVFTATKRVNGITIPLFSCVGYDKEKDDETACLEAERKRLLYVAATRAKRVLIVADARKSTGERDEANPWKFFVDRCEGDFFEDLPVGTIATPPEKEVIAADALYDSAENILLSTDAGKSSYTICRPSQIKLKGKTSAEDDFEDVKEEDVRTHTVRADAAVIGTLVHSLMEAMVSSRNTTPLSALVKEIASEYEAEGDAYVQLLTKVGTTIQNGGFPQENEAPPDILETLLKADEVYCEVPFCRKSGSDIWHGIMDVVYCMDGQWFILDYKTNADAHDLDAKYQAQLEAYVEAFLEMTGHKATPLIYHIDV